MTKQRLFVLDPGYEISMLNIYVFLLQSVAGRQLVRVNKVKLESVVPNSHPETFINVRGQSLTERLILIIQIFSAVLVLS